MTTETPQIKDKVAARQGETSGHMRRVLGASMFLAIVAMGGLYLWFSHGH